MYFYESAGSRLVHDCLLLEFLVLVSSWCTISGQTRQNDDLRKTTTKRHKIWSVRNNTTEPEVQSWVCS